MAISQSQKPQTIKTTNPQSSRLAGFTDTTLEDASAWTTADGVKQDRGWAYADGSTLVNTSGKYNSYLARTGSLVLPNGPFRTKEVTESEVNLSNDKGLTLTYHRCIAYSDINGNWRIKGTFRFSGTGSSSDRINIGFAGVVFLNTGDQTCAITVANTSGTGFTNDWLRDVRIQPNTANIFIGLPAATILGNVKGMYDVALESKPTWADANLESYPVVQLYDSVAAGALGLPEATADVSGIVSLNQVAVAPVNHIINGGDFWQRGGGFSDVGDVSNVSDYTADRWKGRRGTANAGMNVGRSIIIPSNAVVRNSIAINRTNTSTTEMRICQQIESDRCYQLAGKQVTFGLNYAMRVGATFGSAFIRARYSTTADESLDVFGGTDIPEASKELTISGDLVWRTDSVTFTVPSDCAALILIIDIDPAGATFADDYFYVHEPRLYEGDKLYDYVRAGGTYAGELYLCRRRYRLLSQQYTSFIGEYFARASGTTNLRFAIDLGEPMAPGLISCGFPPGGTKFANLYKISDGSASTIPASGYNFLAYVDPARDNYSSKVAINITNPGLSLDSTQYYNVVTPLALENEL